MPRVRVAALQFASGVDCEKNRQKILAMIDKAAQHRPDLMVLPEFANHASWYASPEHCHEVSWSLDGELVGEVAEKARQHQAFVVLNVTLRREGGRCSGSSILFDRQGTIRAVSDKQVLMGHENDFLQRAAAISPVVDTEIGRLGLYACMDGVIAETPRGLARRGAQILCNSLNSFAVDEASLHVPVRAAENKVFVVAANKVGPLIPEEQLAAVSQMIHIPAHFLHGAGESQIVAPDGTVLARASLANEEVVVADIDPSLADCKTRPDGNPIFAHRRPRLYRPLADEPASIPHSSRSRAARVACWQGKATGPGAVEELTAAIPGLDASYDLVVLPELFFVDDLRQVQLGQALELSAAALAAIDAALARRKLRVAGSFLREGPEGLEHRGMLLGKEGVLLEQAQLHRSPRYGQALALGEALPVVELEFGKVGLVVGEDAIYPEVFRLLALAGADLVAVAGHVQERWEIETGLVERAAENRLCLAFASRPQPAGASLLADLEDDFTLLTPWKARVFDGKINMPRVRLAPRFAGVYGHTLHLERARNKQLSARTHLLHDRPWRLLAEGV